MVVPYLDLETPASNRDLAQFVEETVNALAGPGMNEDNLRVYIQVLGQCSGSGRIPRTTGGLLFTVSHQGKPIYVPIRDVQELAMTPRLILEERHLTLEMAMKEEMVMKERLRYSQTPRMSF